MKSNRITIVLLAFTMLSVAFASSGYYRADFMHPKDAVKKWGTKPLDKDLFKNGDHTKRESMAVDVVTKDHYVGKPMKLVRSELGDPDSYFFSDTIYAYKIMPYPGEGKEIWHLVFIPDEKLEKVKEVKIHKKCCYKPLQQFISAQAVLNCTTWGRQFLVRTEILFYTSISYPQFEQQNRDGVQFD